MIEKIIKMTEVCRFLGLNKRTYGKLEDIPTKHLSKLDDLFILMLPEEWKTIRDKICEKRKK